jgi:hypothetical protein
VAAVPDIPDRGHWHLGLHGPHGGPAAPQADCRRRSVRSG